MIRVLRPVLTILTLALLASACAPEAADPEPEVSLLESLDEGWNRIEPGGDTVCSDGSPFHFFAHPGDPENVVFYLQGGGGCWSSETCDPQGQPTYTMTALQDLRSPSGTEPEEGARHGIVAFGHPDNPFADHSFVFVPYCTGDVHIGNREATYTVAATGDSPEREVTVHHKGYVNGVAALDWTYEHFPQLDSVFVTGSSAGSIPSPVYARHFAQKYPDARVTALGDGAGGYRNIGDSRPHEAWGTLSALSDFENVASLSTEEFSFESLFTTAGQAHPEVTLARYDTAQDDVQLRFLAISGIAPDGGLQPLLDANEADIDAALEGAATYRSYIAPGELHTILLRPEFYTYSTNGTRVRDWVASLAAGESVEDVHCGACDMAPIPEGADATGGSH